MTHDDLTTCLRDPRPVMSIDAQTTMLDAADRLDRYKDLLKEVLLVKCEWGGRRELLNGIWEALK